MIASLRGEVTHVGKDAAIVEVQGVGYHVLMPLPDVARYTNPGTKAEAYIHTHVREDAIQLYGFSTRGGLSLFERHSNDTTRMIRKNRTSRRAM